MFHTILRNHFNTMCHLTAYILLVGRLCVIVDKKVSFRGVKTYHELNNELSFLIGVPVHRHTFVLDIFNIIVLNNLACNEKQKAQHHCEMSEVWIVTCAT